MAERSLQRRSFELSHARARQASTSSSEPSSATDDKSTSSNPRRRRASPASGVHQPAVAVTGEPSRRRATKQTSAGPRERSSKGSSLNMTAPVDSAGEVSYTPTTHRISKAKKGKKVHVCEFPGCNKVFTRAEHRKRHEANHNPNPKFECHVEDCRKGFQRADLLNRHLERQHELPAGTTSRPPGSYRSMSETSSNPPSGSIMPTGMGQPQPVAAQSMSHGPGAMAITSIIEHPMQELSHSTHGMGDLAHLGVCPTPISYPAEWAYGRMHPGDSPVYSSDSCSSPMSDYPNPQMPYQPFQDGIQRPPSTFSDSGFNHGTITSPLSAGSSFPPAWGTDPAPAYDGSYVQTVGSQNLGQLMSPGETNVELDPALQLPLSANVGGQHWVPLRSQSASTAGMVLGPSSLLKVHDPSWHYLECYWQHFHPLFPIVRLASFMSSTPQPWLAASMVVVGAQFSPRPDAKQYSSSQYAACLEMMSESASVTSQSSVSDMQAIIHMELFARYRARSAKVEYLQGSPQFQSLYASLMADQRSLHTRAANLQRTLRAMSAPTELRTACTRWIDLEARRRVLAAAFVLDTQHCHLFQQQPFYTGKLGEDGLDLPFPNSAEAWNCANLLTWRDLVIFGQHLSTSSLDLNVQPLDPFQSSVLMCYQIHCLRSSDDLIQGDIILHPTKSHFIAATFTHHAFSLSNHTPLHALIITASESWLFGTKIMEETVWQQAKTTLRGWVAGDAAKKAVWHATQLLRLAFQNQNQQQQQQPDGNGCLHDLWCLYTAALVCWAFGYGTAVDVETRDEYTAENAEMLAADYLRAMDVPTWGYVLDVPESARRSTSGLLECVRVRVGDTDMGGLLNGAEDVLFRLVEGHSEAVIF